VLEDKLNALLHLDCIEVKECVRMFIEQAYFYRSVVDFTQLEVLPQVTHVFVDLFLANYLGFG
jgi:hypothetical protein